MTPHRPRRRAVRRSPAVDYDRTADQPEPGSWRQRGHPDREVVDDIEAPLGSPAAGDDSVGATDDETGAADRLLDDRPPHYGSSG